MRIYITDRKGCQREISLIRLWRRWTEIFSFKIRPGEIAAWAFVLSAAALLILKPYLSHSAAEAASIIDGSKYGCASDGSETEPFGGVSAGQVAFSGGLRAALADPANEKAYFHVRIYALLTQAEEAPAPSAAASAAPEGAGSGKLIRRLIRRLRGSGLFVWSLGGGKNALAGLLTGEQLSGLEAGGQYGLYVTWACGDG